LRGGREVKKVVKKQLRRMTRSDKRGLPPGTAVYVGDEPKTEVKVTVINYNENFYEEKTVSSIEQSYGSLTSEKNTWINVTGIHDVRAIEKIGLKIGLHPLFIEDIVNSEHRPKLEIGNEQMLAIVKRLYFDIDYDQLDTEQISIILTRKLVITFQEKPDDDFELIRNQLRNSVGDIRSLSIDFLYYRLLDSVVDRYLIELESMNDRIEALEEAIIKHPEQHLIHKIYSFKKQSNMLKKVISPIKDVIMRIQKSNFPFLTENTKYFLHDVHDHMAEVFDQVDTTKSTITSLLDVYYSSVSYKMNEIMKVLTIVSTTFIPLTFIAGIYGMNFSHMPELHSKWGYPAVWALMLVITIFMFIYFRRKKWF
jgi:magnesium transporter